MSFFEAPPPPPEPPEPPREAWSGPANNVLGVTVPLDLVLAETAQAVVTVGHAVAYPDGFELETLVRVRDREVGEHLPAIHRWVHGRKPDATTLPDELYRFGLELADGSRATTVEGRLPFAQPGEVVRGPVLVPRGGGGSLDRWHQAFWCWPLPPSGPLAFVCEWPAAGIALTRVEIEAERILAAAAAARTLWEDETGGARSAGHGYITVQAVRPVPPPSAS